MRKTLQSLVFKNRKPRPNGGFTLIELMLVVAIIGIIASTGIPRVQSLLTRAKEGKIKGNLGAVRSAVRIYYSDNSGVYPTDLNAALTTDRKYLNNLPTVQIPQNGGNPGHSAMGGDTTTLNDMTSGAYFFIPAGSTNEGVVSINCTHVDSNGFTWSTY